MTTHVEPGDRGFMPGPHVKAVEVGGERVAPLSGCPHPNDIDKRRIEKALNARKRYRYVSPRVVPTEGGYRIESPCCSRNIDPEGGIVDVALLLYCSEPPGWRLYRKDHRSGKWHLDAPFTRLNALLDHLNADPGRQFWQ